MTNVPAWQPLTTYSPGAQVIRATAAPIVVAAPANSGFEDGDQDWTKETADPGYQTWAIETHDSAFEGAYSARLRKTGIGLANPVYKRIYATVPFAALPNQAIEASCMVQQGGASAGNAGAMVQLEWLDAGMVSLRIDNGNLVKKGSDGAWKISTVTATAPAGTAYVRIGASGFQTENKRVSVDKFIWNDEYAGRYE